jgi:iron complex transport system substrate-binding protein
MAVRLTRRETLIGAAAVAGCGRGPTRGDVLAAGQPAAILMLALAPQRLIGWPRRLSPEALALLPPGANRPETGSLSSGDAPAGLEAVAALRPRLILDYGDVDRRHRDIAERVQARLGTPFHLIDGALSATPDALLRAGRLLQADRRAERLADEARQVLDRWRGAARAGPRFYYARGADGLETGFAGALATQVLEGAGWTNVAVGGRSIGRVSREQVAAWAPEVVVTLDRRFAAGAAQDPFWRAAGAGRRRLLVLPDLPFGWIDRPPSINRLLGCAWLTGGDAAAAALSRTLWGEAAAPAPSARWIP